MTTTRCRLGRADERSSLTLNFMHRSHDYGNFIKDETSTHRHRFDLYNNISLTYNFKEGTATPGFFRCFRNYKAANNTQDDIYEADEHIGENEFVTHKYLSRNELSTFQKMQGFDSKSTAGRPTRFTGAHPKVTSTARTTRLQTALTTCMTRLVSATSGLRFSGRALTKPAASVVIGCRKSPSITVRKTRRNFTRGGGVSTEFLRGKCSTMT